MRKGRRLTKQRDFAAVRREGKGSSDRFLVLITRPNSLEVSRFGFSVGKRVGKAVVRNRVKRRLREAASANHVHEGWDLLFIPRKGASSVDYHRLRRSVATLLKRAGVLNAAGEVT